jgi:hypothetical protein
MNASIFSKRKPTLLLKMVSILGIVDNFIGKTLSESYNVLFDGASGIFLKTWGLYRTYLV